MTDFVTEGHRYVFDDGYKLSDLQDAAKRWVAQWLDASEGCVFTGRVFTDIYGNRRYGRQRGDANPNA